MSTNIGPESPPRYADFTKQYIGGEWREGRSSSHVIEDTNPFDGSVIARIRGASVEDVSEAYRCAERAQLGWAVSSPRERSTILRRAADLILRRRDEIIEASIREVGGVRKFAEIARTTRVGHWRQQRYRVRDRHTSARRRRDGAGRGPNRPWPSERSALRHRGRHLG